MRREVYIYDLAVADYDQKLVTALREVTDALQSAHSLDTRIDSTRSARSAAQSAFDLARTRYRAGIGTEVRNLVGVLITNRRLASLPAVAQAFGALLAERRGQQTAEVTTAHPLSETQRAQIVARLTEAGLSGVRLSEHVDASILGGLIVRIGSRLYDNSIKSKLQRLQYAMKGAA